MSHEHSPPDAVVVPASRAKLAAIFLGSVAFVLLGAWLVRDGWGDDPTTIVVGLASVAFFGFCGVTVAWRLARGTPALVIDQRGIFDNSSGLSVGLIRWDEIAQLKVYRFQDQVFLGVQPKDLDSLLARQPAWKRAAIRANCRLGALPVNIPQVALPMPASELMQQIARYRTI